MMKTKRGRDGAGRLPLPADRPCWCDRGRAVHIHGGSCLFGLVLIERVERTLTPTAAFSAFFGHLGAEFLDSRDRVLR